MSDVVAITSFFCDLAPQLGSWLAARQMHIMMLRAVMRAPLTFFDTTPIGRIISRFAKDVDILDTSLPPQISDTIYCLFEVIVFANKCRENQRVGNSKFYISFLLTSPRFFIVFPYNVLALYTLFHQCKETLYSHQIMLYLNVYLTLVLHI